MVAIEFIQGESTFKINNITLVRNFHSYVSVTKLRIVNAYDTRNELLPYTLFSDISVNGITYASALELAEALAPILFLKQGGSDTGGTPSYSGNIITKAVQVQINWSNDPIAQIVAFVNGQEFVVLGTQRILFKAVRIIGDIDNSHSAEIHYYEFKPGKGNYGTNGTDITALDIEYISYVTNAQNNVIDLGEISSTPIEVAVNGAGPFAINKALINLFKATRNAVAVNYIYVGNESNIGDGEAQTINSDYLDVNAAPVEDPNQVDGKSAYEIAVDFGFVGTEEEWLTSLVGPEGPTAVSSDAGNTATIGSDGKVFVPEGSGWTAPISYLTMAALYADQANQITGGNYRVDDASAHPDVNAGRAWFDYKGTTAGNDTDYILKSEEESLNLDAQLTAIENRLTALEAEEIPTEEQIIGSTYENAAATGTVNLDLTTFSDAFLTLTGNTTITVSNTHAADKTFAKTATIKSTATETLTLPVGWTIVGEFAATGVENYLYIKFSNFTTAGAKVVCTIDQV